MLGTFDMDVAGEVGSHSGADRRLCVEWGFSMQTVQSSFRVEGFAAEGLH